MGFDGDKYLYRWPEPLVGLTGGSTGSASAIDIGFMGGRVVLVTGGGDGKVVTTVVEPVLTDGACAGLVGALTGFSVKGLMTGSGGSLTTSSGVVLVEVGGEDVFTTGGGGGSAFGGAAVRATVLVGCRGAFVLGATWATIFVGEGGASSFSSA